MYNFPKLFYPMLTFRLLSLCDAALSFPFCITARWFVNKLSLKKNREMRILPSVHTNKSLTFTLKNFDFVISLHLKILPEHTVTIDNMTKQAASSLIHTQWHQNLSFWWHWHVQWHNCLLLRGVLKILRKKMALTGQSWCFVVCMNCVERCTYCFASFNSDLRNGSKRLKKDGSKAPLPSMALLCYWTLPPTVYFKTMHAWQNLFEDLII